MGNELLEMKNITKVYPNGIVANDGINFSVKEGEIHALMGENGAGKSTLMKILFGIEQPEEGDILLRGQKVSLTSPNVAIKHGIGMVHQHFMLVPSLTVAENMVLGVEPKKLGLIDMDKAITMTEELSKKYNLTVDAKAKVEDLPVGIKQKVEILKALLRGAKILILDEPTAVLTPQETEELFVELVNLKKQGYTMIFISHKLKEIKQICDRITIMRNGKHMGVFDVAGVTEEDISRLMVGRDVVLKVDKEKANPKDTVVKADGICFNDETGKQILKDISFSVRSGEILGVAGVEGNGQRELVEVLTGMAKASKGDVVNSGVDIKNLSIKQIRRLGTSHIPEDRMTHGVAGSVSIEQNIISDKYDSKELSGKFFMNMKKIRELSEKLVKDYRVKCNSIHQGVKMLSGGNIQKVVVAREFSSNPKFIIANQPTRGIDVGATEFIRKKLVELRDDGTAVMLVSADLNEVLELSDSLIVMYGGEITAYFEDASKITEEELGFYMLGVKKQSPEEIRRALYA
ncbi:simple sugar transport system ATP-binding protein [Clostridium collagenovorans DSM 3089]|uniref:Simple sugar transport system ATP-binding protein n=1 Tax=Clostridium collagenovorans DSM 3089 TaxID=1121306 RepID=A0A1M5WPC0_9CLOT|nr:ABC transporter ATP-binding protein [Clostridium collagenovorans]SHH88974.1 simple sugar transport system ATP-binding protein [Clostridium collagenovorans DSM 3089]